jgi:hypothetical protein
MDLTNLKRIIEQQAQSELDTKKRLEQLSANVDLQKTIVKSFSMLVDYLDGKTSKTLVVNQLKEIATPDALKVVSAVEDLHETLKTHQNVDLTEMTTVLKSILDEAKLIPKNLPEEKEDKDYTEQFANMVEAVKSLEKIVKEKDLSVTVQEREHEAPVVNVEAPNLEPLRKEMANVVKSVKSLVFPEYKTDNKEVEKLLKKSNELLKGLLEKPVGGGGGGGSSWVAVNESGVPVPIELQSGAVPITGSITASASTLADFAINDSDNTTTPDTEYYGFTKPDGTWLIKKATETTTRYATETNNGSVTTYADAWAAIATLTYGVFHEAF